jgi:GNAT superfamily N-acetyltransferase
MKLCLAETSDLPELCRMILAFRDGLRAARPREAELAAYLPEVHADPSNEFGLAVEPDGRPVGYSQTHFFRSTWSVGVAAHLEDLFVLPEARGRQVGGRLLEFAIERAEARQAVAIGLNTNENNAPAHALYRKAGFEPASEAVWQGGRELHWIRTLG